MRAKRKAPSVIIVTALLALTGTLGLSVLHAQAASPMELYGPLADPENPHADPQSACWEYCPWV